MSQIEIPPSTIFKAGGMAVIAATIANFLTRLILGFVMPLSSEFPPFQYSSIIFFTVTFTVIGWIVLAVVNRFTANPMKIYNPLAIAAGLASIIPNLALVLDPSPMAANMPDASGANFGILIVFHVVAAITYLVTLNRLVR